jgi:hypothetical protein
MDVISALPGVVVVESRNGSDVLVVSIDAASFEETRTILERRACEVEGFRVVCRYRDSAT